MPWQTTCCLTLRRGEIQRTPLLRCILLLLVVKFLSELEAIGGYQLRGGTKVVSSSVLRFSARPKKIHYSCWRWMGYRFGKVESHDVRILDKLDGWMYFVYCK